MAELNEGRSSRNWHSSVRASLRFCSLIRKGKKRMVVLASSRRGMSGDCRPYSYLRSTWSVCLDALGAQIQRWPLPRFLELCSWSHIVSRRVFVSRFNEEMDAAHHHPAISTCTTTSDRTECRPILLSSCRSDHHCPGTQCESPGNNSVNRKALAL